MRSSSVPFGGDDGAGDRCRLAAGRVGRRVVESTGWPRAASSALFLNRSLAPARDTRVDLPRAPRSAVGGPPTRAAGTRSHGVLARRSTATGLAAFGRWFTSGEGAQGPDRPKARRVLPLSHSSGQVSITGSYCAYVPCHEHGTTLSSVLPGNTLAPWSWKVALRDSLRIEEFLDRVPDPGDPLPLATRPGRWRCAGDITTNSRQHAADRGNTVKMTLGGKNRWRGLQEDSR